MRRWPIRDALYWVHTVKAPIQTPWIAGSRHLSQRAEDALHVTAVPALPPLQPISKAVPTSLGSAEPPYPDYSAASSRVYHIIKDRKGPQKLDAAVRQVQAFLAESDKRRSYDFAARHIEQAEALINSESTMALDQIRARFDAEGRRSQARVSKLLSFTLGLVLQEPNSLVQAGKLCDMMLARGIQPNPAIMTTMLQRAIVRFESESGSRKTTREAIFTLLRQGLSLVPQADLHLFSLVMATHVRLGTPTPEIVQVVQASMTTAGFAPQEWPAEAFDAVISAFRRDGDLTSCRRWYDDYRASTQPIGSAGTAARHWPYVSMLFAQQERGKHSQNTQAMMDITSEMRQDGLDPSAEILNMLLRRAKDTCNIEVAEQIWTMLEGQRNIESCIQVIRDASATALRPLVAEAMPIYRDANPKMQSRFLHAIVKEAVEKDLQLCLWALRQYTAYGLVMTDDTIDALGRGLLRFWLRERLERDWSQDVFGIKGLGIWQATHGDLSSKTSPSQVRRRRITPRMWAALEKQIERESGTSLSRSLPLTRPVARYDRTSKVQLSQASDTTTLPPLSTSIPPSLYSMVRYCSQRNHDSHIYVQGFTRLIERCIAADAKRSRGGGGEGEMEQGARKLELEQDTMFLA